LGLSGAGDPEEPTPDSGARRREVGRNGQASAMGAGLSFRGEVAGEGDFSIAGKFEGDINVTGRVLVSDGALVEANISALSIVIGGEGPRNPPPPPRLGILPPPGVPGPVQTGRHCAPA